MEVVNVEWYSLLLVYVTIWIVAVAVVVAGGFLLLIVIDAAHVVAGDGSCDDRCGDRGQILRGLCSSPLLQFRCSGKLRLSFFLKEANMLEMHISFSCPFVVSV